MQTNLKKSISASTHFRKSILFLLTIVATTIFLGCEKAGSTDDSWKEIKEEDVVLGNRNANVLIIEYFDLSCPACAVAHKSVASAWRLIKDDVVFVMRHFPLTQIHPNAYLAAQYLEASRSADAFFAYQTKLYDNQAEWSYSDNPEKLFLEYATEIGLNAEELQKSFTEVKNNNRIDEDIDSGETAEVSGTPTFFINGVKMNFPQNGEALYKAVQAARQEALSKKE